MYAKYLLLAALVYMPVFGHLDTLPIRIWDEARLAMSAVEMSKNENWLTVYFEGAPEMWSTKPPFMIWCQVLFLKTIGINELAIRLPAAFATLFTCLALFHFCEKELKNFWLGCCTVMVLITAHGYITLHGARTGDYDAMLALFTTLASLHFFKFIKNKSNRDLYVFFAALTLGVLTKGIAAMLFSPAYFLFAFFEKEVLNTLKNKHFWIGLTAFLTAALGYYFLREHYNPGYIKAVQENELCGRAFSNLENHRADFGFYFRNMFETKFTFWLAFVPIGFIVGLLQKNLKVNSSTQYFALLSIVYFAIITLAQTKLHWYDLPLYPFLSFIAALAVYFIFGWIKNTQIGFLKYNISGALSVLYLIVLFFLPYQSILKKTYLPKEPEVENFRSSEIRNFYEIGYYFKEAMAGKVDLNDRFWINGDYAPQNVFYIEALKSKGVRINTKPKEEIAINETVFTADEEVKKYIEENFLYQSENASHSVQTFKILKKIE